MKVLLIYFLYAMFLLLYVYANINKILMQTFSCSLQFEDSLFSLWLKQKSLQEYIYFKKNYNAYVSKEIRSLMFVAALKL